jgi:hypothetical protein
VIRPALALLLALVAGCASRSVHAGSDALERIFATSPAEARPAALARVEVSGEDLHRAWDDLSLIWIPLVPFARRGGPVVRANELEPEVERAVFPHFQNRSGQRKVVLRITIEKGREEEVRTAYGLSVAGMALAAVLGAPTRFHEATVEADIALLDAAAPPAARPLFAKRVTASYSAVAGVAGLFFWYNTDVAPRDVMWEAWASALEDFVAAMPPATSPMWKAPATGPR